MKIRDYRERQKDKGRICNVADLANDFGVAHMTMYQWIKDDADISGPTGSRVIRINSEKAVLAREVAKEVQISE